MWCKQSAVVCSVIYAAFMVEASRGDLNTKNQEQIWSWGRYATEQPNANDYKEQNYETTARSFLTNDDEDPCSPLNSTAPDFSGSNRRLSETKCYEYIWNIKYRMEKAERQKECMAKRIGRSRNKVIGGRFVVQSEFPHMGGIGWKLKSGDYDFKCGCSLISPKFVLTAAHCASTSTYDDTVDDIVPKIVRLTDKDISNTGFMNPSLDVNISRIIVHPLHHGPKKYYDIALMQLENEVKFSEYRQPACLWTNVDINVSQATVTGWGISDLAKRALSPNLRAAELDIIDSETCDKLLKPYCTRRWCGLQDHQICAGKMSGGVDSCQGDSGGPLQVKINLPVSLQQGVMYYIVGVTSFGIGCGNENLPGVYVRVASFLDWIENIVWQ